MGFFLNKAGTKKNQNLVEGRSRQKELFRQSRYVQQLLQPFESLLYLQRIGNIGLPLKPEISISYHKIWKGHFPDGEPTCRSRARCCIPPDGALGLPRITTDFRLVVIAP
jgi:hypothetical protein